MSSCSSSSAVSTTARPRSTTRCNGGHHNDGARRRGRLRDHEEEIRAELHVARRFRRNAEERGISGCEAVATRCVPNEGMGDEGPLKDEVVRILFRHGQVGNQYETPAVSVTCGVLM